MEKENRNPYERIFELEEETRQKEQRQAKRIQEITGVYRQRHRKLSELVNFTERYFPYVKRLMPTIRFLCDTLNFGDRLIRKLCAFKDVLIKGDLYSPKFRQHFEADGTVYSLKQNTEDNFDFKINGVSRVSWFRHKRDEFMEALGLPTRKQNRGVQL